MTDMQHKKQDKQHAVRLVVCGVGGRMGQAVLQAAQHTSALHVVAGVVSPNSSHVDKQAKQCWPACHTNFDVYSSLTQALQHNDNNGLVVLDFSVADLCDDHAQTCQQHKVAYVTGVTGLQPAHHKALQHASQTVAVLHAPNMSLGVNVLRSLCCLAAQLLPDADIEISELHHRLKRDHPSGTALWMAQGVAQSRGWPADCVQSQHRQGVRKKQEIGVTSLRGGDERGSHTVHMLLQDEALQLTHRAASRTVYAHGALQACQYVSNQPAGQYTMQDVLTSFLPENLRNVLDCNQTTTS